MVVQLSIFMGNRKSFEGVVRRANYLQSSVIAFDAFQQHYVVLQQCYEVFFSDVKKIAFQQFELMQKL